MGQTDLQRKPANHRRRCFVADWGGILIREIPDRALGDAGLGSSVSSPLAI